MNVFNLRIAFCVIALIVAGRSFAQSNALGNTNDFQAPEKSPISLDFFLTPAVFYYGTKLGVNYQPTTKIEHSFTLGASYYLLGARSKTFDLNYNFNIYHRKGKSYLPLWLGFRNSVTGDIGYEEGYFPNTLRLSLGTGYGRKTTLFKKCTMRYEVAAGASINLTNSDRSVNLPLSRLQDYSFDKYYPQYNPKIFPAVRLKVTLIKHFYRRSA